MKTVVSLFLIVAGFNACNSSGVANQDLRNRVDSLQQKLSSVYKPGFGEFMSGIQVHHAKLWFAGQNNNWPLADFEMHEIKEALDDLKIFQKERPETKHLDMLDIPLDSTDKSIQNKNAVQFKSSFILLTNTCNNCHVEVNFEFNKVKIPDSPPFSNQDFSLPAEQKK